MARSEKRRKLFDQGAYAYARARPDAPIGYACPLCLRCSSKVDRFSLEHVPPASVGGRELVLTCTECNSFGGSQVDRHLAMGDREAKVASGEQTQEVRLAIAGQVTTATAQIKDGILDLKVAMPRGGPEAYARLVEEVKEASTSIDGNLNFNIAWNTKHDPWREAVAWLRVGYLHAFAFLGFTYILRPELELVREQIRKPEERLVPQLIGRSRSPSAANTIQFVFEPIEFRSIVMAVSDRVIILPDFERPSTFDRRFLRNPAEQWPAKLSLKLIPLPAKPLFLLDFYPSLIRLVSPEFPESQGDGDVIEYSSGDE